MSNAQTLRVQQNAIKYEGKVQTRVLKHFLSCFLRRDIENGAKEKAHVSGCIIMQLHSILHKG